MDIFSIREIIHQNKEDLWVKIGHYDYFYITPLFLSPNIFWIFISFYGICL